MIRSAAELKAFFPAITKDFTDDITINNFYHTESCKYKSKVFDAKDIDKKFRLEACHQWLEW